MTNRAPDFDIFKGYPVIKIYTGKKFFKDGEEQEEAVSLGYRKARAICDQIDYLRQFVDRCEKTGDNK